MAWNALSDASPRTNQIGSTKGFKDDIAAATFTSTGDATAEFEQHQAALVAAERLAQVVGRGQSLLTVTLSGTGTADHAGPGETITVTVKAVGG